MPSSGSPTKYGDSASLGGEPGSNRADLRELVGEQRRILTRILLTRPNKRASFIPPIPRDSSIKKTKCQIRNCRRSRVRGRAGRRGSPWRVTLVGSPQPTRRAAERRVGARRELGRWGRECARRDGDWPPRRRVLLTRARPNPLALPVGHRLRPTREPWRATA